MAAGKSKAAQALGKQAHALDKLIEQTEAEVRDGTQALEELRAARKAISADSVRPRAGGRRSTSRS